MSWHTYWRLVFVLAAAFIAAMCYVGGRNAGRAEGRFNTCWELRRDCGEDIYSKVCE